MKIKVDKKKTYQNLYKSSEINVTKNELTFFNNLNIPRISEQETKKCEGEIKESECLKILSDFKLNKTPGTDGFQVEFYKYFGVILKT